MPAVSAPANILVSGASGFLAVHVCRILLEQGYNVIGTVRSTSKGTYLKTLFDNFAPKFSFIVVEDVEKPGAFDEAVKGVDAVEHTASPFHYTAEDPDEIIGPAVRGTTGILESILKHGSQVKRVIVTSSTAAVITPQTPPHSFTEEDWNTNSPRIVETEGKKAPGFHKYMASKALAERAAWDFVKENKANISWDLATINPTYIFGPTLHEIKDLSALNESISMFHKWIVKPPTTAAAVGGYSANQVDVRDAALAHVLALENESAGGERFILSQGPHTIQDVYDALREARVANVPEGFPGSGKDKIHNRYDGSKVTRVLGLKYHSQSETFVDTLKSIRERFPEAANKL